MRMRKRGKIIGSVLVIHKKKSPDLGILVSAQCYQDVKTGKKSGKTWLQSTS